MDNRDLVFEVLLNLPGARFPCSTNSIYASVCNDEYFWKKYLQKYTDVDFTFKGLKYKQTARIVFQFINEIFRIFNNPKLLISTWALRSFMKFCNENTENMETLLTNILVGVEESLDTEFKIIDITLLEIMLIEFSPIERALTEEYTLKHNKLGTIDSRYLMDYFLNSVRSKMKYLNINKEIEMINLNLDDTFVMLNKLTNEDIPNTYNVYQIGGMMGMLIEMNKSFQ
jgi:hypothetical protein